MVRERRAPAVQDRGEADAGAEVLRVGGDGDERLGRGLEQDVVDHGLVLVGDVGDRRRQREHDVIVRHGQQLGFALGQPLLCRRALALRTMPIAAGVVGDARVRTLLAALDMPAESRLRQLSMADMTLSWPRLTWPALARRHAGPWARKTSATSSEGRDKSAALYAGGGTVVARRSSGLVTLPSALMATWV